MRASAPIEARAARRLPILVATVAIALLASKGCAMMTAHQAFDPQRWQAERGRDGGRNAMLAALERDQLRRGMSRDAVRKLLGEPDAVTPTVDEYDLGPSPVGATMESYAIEYDAQGHVVGYALRRK